MILLHFENEFIASLIHKIVAAIKTKFQPDWTSSHRMDVESSVTLAVKNVLIRERIIGEQYKDWPLEA